MESLKNSFEHLKNVIISSNPNPWYGAMIDALSSFENEFNQYLESKEPTLVKESMVVVDTMIEELTAVEEQTIDEPTVVEEPIVEEPTVVEEPVVKKIVKKTTTK